MKNRKFTDINFFEIDEIIPQKKYYTLTEASELLPQFEGPLNISRYLRYAHMIYPNGFPQKDFQKCGWFQAIKRPNPYGYDYEIKLSEECIKVFKNFDPKNCGMFELLH